MAFVPIDSHFEVIPDEPRLDRNWIPGYTGPVYKLLNAPVPVRIRQYGYCESNQVSELLSGRGNVNAVVNVVTHLQNTFTNCFKLNSNALPEMTADNGKIAYEIIWEQTET